MLFGALRSWHSQLGSFGSSGELDRQTPERKSQFSVSQDHSGNFVQPRRTLRSLWAQSAAQPLRWRAKATCGNLKSTEAKHCTAAGPRTRGGIAPPINAVRLPSNQSEAFSVVWLLQRTHKLRITQAASGTGRTGYATLRSCQLVHLRGCCYVPVGKSMLLLAKRRLAEEGGPINSASCHPVAICRERLGALPASKFRGACRFRCRGGVALRHRVLRAAVCFGSGSHAQTRLLPDVTFASELTHLPACAVLLQRVCLWVRYPRCRSPLLCCRTLAIPPH